MGKFKIESTLKDAPERVLVYGPGGVGKSTLGAAAGCIFISAEDGLKNIDARAVQPYPQNWQDILDAVDELAGDDDCKGIALDSLDWAEPLCWRHVCDAAKKSDIEAFGYGKGYLAALDQWRVLLHKLSNAHARGKRIVLIAHAVRKMFKNPLGDDFEHWTIKLNEKAAGLLVEWCDVVGFAEQETNVVEASEKSNRFKALTTGKRILRTNPNPAYLAKTRYALPAKIVMPAPPANAWEPIANAIRARGPAAVEKLQNELAAKLSELDDKAVNDGCNAFIKERGVSVASLNEAIQTVDDYLAERRKAS